MTLKRSIFPLCNITVAINEVKVNLSPKKKTTISLKEAEDYRIEVTAPLLFKKNIKTVSQLSEKATIKVRSSIPDGYYLLVGGFTLMICILFFFEKTSMLFFFLALVLYFIPILYYSFIKTDKYFVIDIN